MKALSIRQPWAWLILNGWKSIENRTWRTNYRGEFLIHASKTFDPNAFDFLHSMFWDDGTTIEAEGISTNKKDYRMGGFVGRSHIVACLQYSNSAFFTGPYGFKLLDSEPIEFIEYPGSLGFFNAPDSVVNKIELITVK